jgi:hypothetical protein
VSHGAGRHRGVRHDARELWNGSCPDDGGAGGGVAVLPRQRDGDGLHPRRGLDEVERKGGTDALRAEHAPRQEREATKSHAEQPPRRPLRP